MKRTRPWPALVALTASMSGCANLRYSTGAIPQKEAHTEWSHFFVGGLVGHKQVALDAICPNGVARVRTFTSFTNGLVTIFPGVFGLVWSPRSVEIHCAESPAPGGAR